MSFRTRLLAVALYATLSAVLLAIVFKLLPHVLPDLVAGRIARNSEGILLTLILAGWIQFARPRLAGTATEWRTTTLVALAALLVAVVLFLTEPVNQVKTLNESFMAAAVLIPYLQLPRPVPRALPLGLSLGLVAVVLLGHSTEVITLTAEALGALVLVPFGLDVVDRAILDPTARTVGWHRATWYTFLVAGPLVFWRTDNGGTLDGGLRELLTYAGRTTEIFLCLLALHLYFAIGLGRDGRAPVITGADQTAPARTTQSGSISR